MIMFLCVISSVVDNAPAIGYHKVHVQCGEICRQVGFANFSRNVKSGLCQWFEFVCQQMAMPRAHIVSFDVRFRSLWVRYLQIVQCFLSQIQDWLDRGQITHKNGKLGSNFNTTNLN